MVDWVAVPETFVVLRNIQTKVPELMGTSEIAEFLGVGKPRVNELARIGLLPTPVAVLRSGPIWDATSVREFAKAWDRVPGFMRPSYDRYVEVSFRVPGRGTRHTAVVIEAAFPDDIEAEAKRAVLERCPAASHIKVLNQRIVTTRTAKSIARSIADGTWSGWRFEGRAS